MANFDPVLSLNPPAPVSAIGGNGDGLIAWKNAVSMTKTQIEVRRVTPGSSAR